MAAPDQTTIDHLRAATRSMRTASAPLDEDDPIREKIEDVCYRLGNLVDELEQLRDNT